MFFKSLRKYFETHYSQEILNTNERLQRRHSLSSFISNVDALPQPLSLSKLAVYALLSEYDHEVTVRMYIHK